MGIVMGGKLVLKPARLGKISYINTLPFYHGWLEPDDPISVWEGTPAEINRAMRAGAVDLAPISSLEYALRQEEYLVFPDLCIGSRDFARSVLLLSHEKIEGLNRRKIVLSDKSLSSQALLRILLKFKYGFDNEFETSNGTPDHMLAQGNAALVIGDEALFYRPEKFVYKYDLSELWWSWTGLPFCFAVWAVRRGFWEENQEETVRLYTRLKETTERNMADLEKLILEGLGMTLADKRFPQVFGYLFNLIFHFDGEMKSGLLRFYHDAFRAGLAPEVTSLHMAEV